MRCTLVLTRLIRFGEVPLIIPNDQRIPFILTDLEDPVRAVKKHIAKTASVVGHQVGSIFSNPMILLAYVPLLISELSQVGKYVTQLKLIRFVKADLKRQNVSFYYLLFITRHEIE